MIKKDVGYKIFIWKYVAFLCTNNRVSDWEVKKTTPFTILWKIKYLTKDVKGLHAANYKTLMKVTEDANKWKDICAN